ncbi:MAG: hypothetical protein KUG75_02200 [Pseudomonadales bacterium]|nr:hypothetical protein [Pseudomonadales bacterium]
MFDMKDFIASCQEALLQPEPASIVKGLVEYAVTEPEALREAFAETSGARSLKDAALFLSDELTILDVTTPPGMRTPAHDHQMWAVIGVYDGEEPNEFFLHGNEGLESKSNRILKAGDVAMLDGKTIHAISNPLKRKSYAIHVYGGHIVEQPGRSMWNPHTLAREPYDMDQLGKYVREMRDIPAA